MNTRLPDIKIKDLKKIKFYLKETLFKKII